MEKDVPAVEDSILLAKNSAESSKPNVIKEISFLNLLQ